MNTMDRDFFEGEGVAAGRPVNFSRRRFLGASFSALVLGARLPAPRAPLGQ